MGGNSTWLNRRLSNNFCVVSISVQLLIFTIDYRCVGNVLGIHSIQSKIKIPWMTTSSSRKMISVIHVSFEAEAWWEPRLGVREKMAYWFSEAVSLFLKWATVTDQAISYRWQEIMYVKCPAHNKNSIMLSPFPSPRPAPNSACWKLQQTSGFLGSMSQMELTLFLISVCLLPRPQSWGEGRRL